MERGRDYKLINGTPGQVPRGTFEIPRGQSVHLRKVLPGRRTLVGRMQQASEKSGYPVSG